MKVDRNAPVRSTRSVAQAAYARRVEATDSTSLDEVGPSASVLGIPESEFTPRVRDAIMGLMGEVDNLRRESWIRPAPAWMKWKSPPTRTACCRCSTAALLCAN